MAITFYLQSKKNPSTIYVRIRKRPIDAKARTKYSVNPKWFENGAIKKGNVHFNGLQIKLDELRDQLTGLLNNREEDVIDSAWLKETIK